MPVKACITGSPHRGGSPWVYRVLAVTAPGLEGVCAAELRALGIAARADDGGASWAGDLRSVVRANVELRSASRIIVRVGTFRARTFGELERRAAALPWRHFIAPGTALSLRVTSRKSRLYHTGAVAERLVRVLAAGCGAYAADAASGGDEEYDDPAAQLVIVRFVRDECTISVDSSGALLHRRGYRQAVASAPLRETLAAALLLAAGWRGDTPLADPLCGSGTIAIEAALLARRIAPGLARPDRSPRAFRLERWPEYDPSLLGDVVTAARASIRDRAGVHILARDRSASAIAATRSNAARAGVEADIDTAVQPIDSLLLPPGPGLVATNPPYGVRAGENTELRPLYRELGARVRAARWQLAFVSADPGLDPAAGVPLLELLRTSNGGIPVRFMAAAVDPRPAAGYDSGIAG
jgi:putative N6-adenine-specific DNA methylase